MKHKQEVEAYRIPIMLIGVLVTIIFLCITSCSCNKSLQDKCILNQPEYQHFVDQHNLQDDIDEFLNQ